MPRAPEIKPEDLQSELAKWPSIFEKNKLVGYSHPIWTQIKTALKLNMTAGSLHLYVYNDRHQCKSFLENHFAISGKSDRKRKKDEDPDYAVNADADQNPCGCDALDFDIIIPANKLIQSLAERKLTGIWKRNLHAAIVDAQGLPCAYDYRTRYLTNDIKFKFAGTCSDCKTSIRGESDLIEDLEQDLKIAVHTFATQTINHTKKMKISGEYRKEIKAILLNKLPGDYRLELIGTIKTNYETADLNNTVTYRKIREEAQNEEIGYDKLKSLSISNNTFITHSSIRKLSINPFCVFYWTDDQIDLWNKVQSDRLPLSIDATGSLVKKHIYENGVKSKSIYYYVLVVGLAGKIVPLLQGLLSVHYVAAIQELLSRWIETGAETPKEICTDGCLALQIAINLVFNNVTYKQYNLQCYKVLRSQIDKTKVNEKELLPKCYYRHDIAHLLHAVKRWKALSSADVNVVVFYLRCIGYLTQVTSLQQFEDIATSIIIISQSSTVETECLKRKKLLNEIFKTFEYDFDKFAADCQTSNVQTTDIEIEPNNSDNELTVYIERMFDKALKLSCVNSEITDQANYYHCPGLLTIFKSLCYTFPSWTNIMKDLFGSPNNVGTSARSETFFKKKKESIPYPITMQKFVLKDKKRINCLTKFGFMHTEKNDERFEKGIDDQNFLDIDLEKLQISENPQNVYLNTLDAPPLDHSILDHHVSTAESTIEVSECFQNIAMSSNEELGISYQVNHEETLNCKDSNIQCEKNNRKSVLCDKITVEAEVLDANETPLNTSLLQDTLKDVYQEIKTCVVTEGDDSYTETCCADESTCSTESDTYIHLNFGQWRNLIENGSILPPISTSMMQNVKLINTCPIDSIIELFTMAHCSQGSFRQLVFEIVVSKKSNYEIFTILNKYIEAESRKVYYRSRIDYCKSQPQLYLQTEKSDYLLINCKDNIVRLFNTVMLENYSVQKTITCACNYSNIQRYNIQTVNTDFKMNGSLITGLEDYLKTYFSKRTKECYKCKVRKASVNYKIRSYLCVELETNFLFHSNMECNLNNIPLNLHLCNENYNLVGVIAFDPPCLHADGGLLHYYVYIKLADGRWEERNNLKNVIIIHSKQSKIKIRPALLFYARFNVYKRDLLTYF